MLLETYELLKRNPTVFAFLVLAFCLLTLLGDFIQSRSSSHGAQLFILLLAFRSVQQMVLAGGNGKTINTKGNFSYGWKHLALSATVTVLAVVPLAIGGKTSLNLLVLLLMTLVGYPIALAVLGTWPMGALGLAKVSPGDASPCSRNRFGKAFARILMVFAAKIGIGVAVGFLVTSPTLLSNAHFNPVAIILDIVIQATLVLSLSFIALVISPDYMGYFDPSDPPHGWSPVLPSRCY